MARIRTIKPEFFRNHKLFTLEKETGLPIRLAFAGLWTACDREGRFEWVPEELKLDCLPYDELDYSRVLDALTTRGFVVKYNTRGKYYGYVPGFLEHQVVNNKEKQSTIPKPPENNDNSTRDQRVTNASSSPLNLEQGEGKGKEEEKEEESKYRFAASIVKLTEEDYSRMKKTYHAIPDFDAELQAADGQYLKEPPGNWFCALGNRLNLKHQHHLALKSKMAKKPEVRAGAVNI